MERCGEVVVAADRDEAIEIANRYAHEHVEVHAAEPELDAYLDGLRNYGSLFLGREATVVYGDKAVGTNHVLPTARRGALHGRAVGRQVPEDGTYQRLTERGHAAGRAGRGGHLGRRGVRRPRAHGAHAPRAPRGRGVKRPPRPDRARHRRQPRHRPRLCPCARATRARTSSR